MRGWCVEPSGDSSRDSSAHFISRTYWVLWSELLKRTFRVDVSRCPRCQGTMQRVALVRTPEAITALLPYAEADGEARGPP